MNYHKYYQEITLRLDHLIRSSADDDYTSVSIMLGKNHAYIQQYITRGVPKCLNNKDMLLIKNHFQIDDAYFGKPEDFKSIDFFSMPSSPLIKNEEFIVVKNYDKKETHTVINKKWLSKTESIDPINLVMVTTPDNSMMPTIIKNDQLLIDAAQTRISHNGLYISIKDDIISVFRISINPSNGRYTLMSDNPLFQNWDDITPEDVTIFGTIIWIGHTV